MANVHSGEITTTTPAAKPALNPKAIEFDSLLETGLFADLVIICKGREWKAHKAIVCPQSDFFMRACAGRFSEANSGRIDLSADDEDALATLITYLYHGQPEFTSWNPQAVSHHTRLSDISASEAPMHLLRVHILADKYHIEGLAGIMADRFMDLAERFKYEIEFPTWMVAILEDTSPTSVLRTRIHDLVHENFPEFWHACEGDYTQHVTAFKKALIRCPEFAVSLMAAHFETEHAD